MAVGTKLVRNPKINPDYVSYKLEIRSSKIHRFGVYALENIPANRKVIEYTGKRLNRKQEKRTQKNRGRKDRHYRQIISNSSPSCQTRPP